MKPGDTFGPLTVISDLSKVWNTGRNGEAFPRMSVHLIADLSIPAYWLSVYNFGSGTGVSLYESNSDGSLITGKPVHSGRNSRDVLTWLVSQLTAGKIPLGNRRGPRLNPENFKVKGGLVDRLRLAFSGLNHVQAYVRMNRGSPSLIIEVFIDDPEIDDEDADEDKLCILRLEVTGGKIHEDISPFEFELSKNVLADTMKIKEIVVREAL